MTTVLSDRLSATLRLADRLWHLRGDDALLMAVDRGSISIGSVLARLLGFPLELLSNPDGGIHELAEEDAAPPELPKSAAARPSSSSGRGQTLIVVADGMMAEARLVAALRIARARKPALLVLALPAATPATTVRLRALTDAVLYLQSPPPTKAMQDWCAKLLPVTEAEVAEALRVATS